MKYLIIEVVSDIDCTEPEDSMLNCTNVVAVVEDINEVPVKVQECMDAIIKEFAELGYDYFDWYKELKPATELTFGGKDKQAFCGELQYNGDERIYCADYFVIQQ